MDERNQGRNMKVDGNDHVEWYPVKKTQNKIDNIINRSPGTVKLKDFSIRLTRLKDIPTTLKPRHCGSTGGDTDDSSIDDAIFCLDCGKSYHGDCPVHGPLIPLDESLGLDQDSQSYTSVPVPLQVTVKMSSIMNAGKGVFAKGFIPRRTKIGPYKGEVVHKEDVTDETDTSYFWEVKKTGTESYYIDGKNEEHASWLRFINCARSEEEQNLLSFQYQGNIYCYTIKDILPGTELLVWYGEQYVKLLGLPLDHIIDVNYTCGHCQKQFVEKYNFDIHLKYSEACRDANPQVLKCGKCGEVFTTLINLQQHIRRHEQTSHQTYSSCQEVSNPSTSQTPMPTDDSEALQEPLHTCNGNHSCEGQFSTCDDQQSHTKGHNGKKPHQFQCQYCSRSFNYKVSLHRHLKIHTGEKPHQCQYCQKTFALRYGLTIHLRTHTGEKPHSCKHCGKSFITSSDLTRHERIHSGEKPHQCQYCQKVFVRKGSLKMHLRMHTGEKPYICGVCNKSFSTSSTLKCHLCSDREEKLCKRQHSGARNSVLKKHLSVHQREKCHQCQYCREVFLQSSALRIHLRTHPEHKPLKKEEHSKDLTPSYGRHHTGEKHYQCQYCQKNFTNISALKIHERIHTRTKPYQCQYCNKLFVSSTRLKYHVRVHTGERPYQCQYCQKAYTINYSLIKHLRIHTGENLERCEHCSKTFTTSSDLRYHMATHSSDKPFQCQHCPKAFALNSLLKKHLKTHSGKQYSCQLCSRKFTSSHGLKYHTASHAGEKPYQCRYCQKAFIDNCSLKRHLRVHNGEKPYCGKIYKSSERLKCHLSTCTRKKRYHCQLCNKAFVSSNGLKYHLATHSRENSFQCQLCQKTFSFNYLLQRHLKAHNVEKQYNCQICHRKFASSNGLKYHLVTHTGEKPFQCQLCQKTFSLKYLLQRHLKTQQHLCSRKLKPSKSLKYHKSTHIKEKSYNCQYCSKTFVKSDDLKSHMETHNGTETLTCPHALNN
ncbi:zinc finger protein 709-like isoform X2 [Dysidea avara]|uniref:zinc finger protein 709-like isoform X2 n=1 Tax=Dysidea avara TaxID=196820 RepID=UPI00332B9571